jgi:hypothetical protein
VEYEIDEEFLHAFRTLKQSLISAPNMQPPDWNLPFETMCGASDYAVGSVLGQRKEGKVHTIYYASKTLNEAQVNYATTERELHVVVFVRPKQACGVSLQVGSRMLTSDFKDLRSKGRM